MQEPLSPPLWELGFVGSSKALALSGFGFIYLFFSVSNKEVSFPCSWMITKVPAGETQGSDSALQTAVAPERLLEAKGLKGPIRRLTLRIVSITGNVRREAVERCPCCWQRVQHG